MADPFSVVASAIAIATAGVACSHSLLSIIETIRKAPEELIALSNEVTNLNYIINEARELCGSLAADSSSTSEFITNFETQLRDAKDVLDILNVMVSEYKSMEQTHKQLMLWLRKKKQATKCQMKLKGIRMNIREIIMTANTYYTLRIGMQTQEMQSTIKQMSQGVDSTSATISTIFRLLQQQHDSLENLSSQSPVNLPEIPRRSPLRISYNRSESENNSSSSILENRVLPIQGGAVVSSEPATQSISGTQVSNPSVSKSVTYFKMYKQSNCEGTCDCSCHSRNRIRSPLMLRNFIGTLFAGYTGSLLLGTKCDKTTCRNRADRSFQLTYCFPQWFIERAIYVVLVMTYTGNIKFGLNVRRRIGWGGEDNILRFALTGTTSGVQSLLIDGKASMLDVDQNHGRSALYFAVQYNQVEICKFLLDAGADPYTQDDSGISSYQKAWEQVFTKNGSNKNLQTLQRLFPKEAISETWEFSYLHEVVLDILPGNLATALQDQKYCDQVNIRDYKGRTPLHWAATRGDESAVRLLLENGADVNAQDDWKATPLILAASSGSMRMLELLILGGANARLSDIRGGRALHYVCRHQKEVAPVKLLLNATAQVNCRNIYGHTPFTGAAIKNRHDIGEYLLRNGADMHCGGDNNDTPLFESIFHNSHEFLQLLLQKGAKHTSVNKLGSTILHAAALEADVKTIEILAASKPGDLNVNSLDKNGKTALEISQQRVAPPDGFQDSFKRFLTTIREITCDT